MKKLKQKSYMVQVKVVVDTQLEISANSFEEALKKAKEYDVRDVVEFDTDYNDGNISIIGVFDYSEQN